MGGAKRCPSILAILIGFAAPSLRARRALSHLDHVAVAADNNHDGVDFLAAWLIGWGSKVKLAAVPFSGHQGVVLDHGFLERRHVLLALLDGRGKHRLVLHSGIVL